MWWVLRSLLVTPAAATCAVACVTSDADHVYVAYAPWQPVRHPIYRTFRGRTHLCGYQYIWDTPTIAEQTEPGDTLEHTINLAPLLPETTYWAYVFAPDGPYGLEIQGPLFSFTTILAPPYPDITPDPILFNLDTRYIRTGNRYTWWANGSWYAMVPHPWSLTVWKLVAGVMVRMDQANEPVPPTGLIRDGDSRLQSDDSTIHCCYLAQHAWPYDGTLAYATFTPGPDTWAIHEDICAFGINPYSEGWCSLSLDAADIPHVAYIQWLPAPRGILYRNRIGGVWSPHETAIEVHPQTPSGPSVTHAPATNHFHVMCLTYEKLNYTNSRSPLGDWAGQATLPTLGVNSSHHSAMADPTLPHFAQISATARVNHHEGAPPYDSQLDLSAPTSLNANMIVATDPSTEIAIAFRDADSHLATLYRPTGQPWDPQVQLDPFPIVTLCATYNPQDVISALWLGVTGLQVYFYAFSAPWH